MLCAISRAKIRAWFHNYDNVQSLAVVLLYLQVGCALIGSCSASYMGLLVANLAIALFALIAVESGSQKLGRTYAVLLVCALLLDVAWFVLFSVEIRQSRLQPYVGKFTIFSLQLVLWMQAIGFLVRFLSAFVWLHMYRLGGTSEWRGLYQPLDLERRTASFRVPTASSSPRTTTRQSSLSDEILGGSIYNPAYYSSNFGPAEGVRSIKEVKEGGVI